MNENHEPDPMHQLLNDFQEAVEHETRAQSAYRHAHEAAQRAHQHWARCSEDTMKARVALEEFIEGPGEPSFQSPGLFDSASVESDGETTGPYPPWTTKGIQRRIALSAHLNHRCWYCGGDLAHFEAHFQSIKGWTGWERWEPRPGFLLSVLEHQVPRSQGGTSRADNLVVACSICNSRKLNRDTEGFRGWVSERLGRPVVFFGEDPDGVRPNPLFGIPFAAEIARLKRTTSGSF